MALLSTPICAFDTPAVDFALLGIDGKTWTLQQCKGDNGTLVMFICNHCPYVQAIRERMVRDTRELLGYGIRSVAVMPNDSTDYPEDSFANMTKTAKRFAYPFPYLIDSTQAVAKAYGAVCTPDFFGYNAELRLQYRGRLDDSKREAAAPGARRELFEAMVQVARTGHGPPDQIASMGCSIKWSKD